MIKLHNYIKFFMICLVASISLLTVASPGVTATVYEQALSSPGGIALKYRESRTITVSVVPAEAGANRRIRAASGSPYIATVNEEAVTNDSGTATFSVMGELSGATDITFYLADTRVTGKTNVTVALPGEDAVEMIYYEISAIADTGGTVRGGGNYKEKTTVTLTATPHPDYSFEGWYEGSGCCAAIVHAEVEYIFTATAS